MNYRIFIILLICNITFLFTSYSQVNINIINTEYFWDTDPGEGNATPLFAVDGNYDQAIERVLSSYMTFLNGSHLFGIRVQDTDGNWSSAYKRAVTFEDYTNPINLKVSLAEYFWDTDPGEGNATPLIAFDGAYDEAVEQMLSASITLLNGSHLFGIRVQDTDGNWSSVYKRAVSAEIVTYGCIDTNALNYNPTATVNDGSCLYPVYGCTDSTALNYNPLATNEDSSCIDIIYGCIDTLAWNYDDYANFDDGSCLYSYMCYNPPPNGLYADDIVDIRATIHWNNMNTDSCRVWKNYIRYKKLSDISWTTKAAGVGSGLCNVGLPTQQKILQNLSPNTTYEYKMKSFYCGGMESGYSSPSQFTTAADCPEMTNLTVQTFNGNHSKARFSWDTTGVYVFARVALRIDTAGASWQTAGGFGVYYPTFSVNKFGLQSGQSYRAQGRTFCDSNITIYRSWWTTPVFWTQPGSIRMSGGSAIANFDVYPNPSKDIFNISFVSENIQNL